MLFKSSYPPYDPTDKSGFSYDTVLKRWPVILTGIINYLHGACHDFSLESQKPNAEKALLDAKIAEAKGIIGEISKLKYEMSRDHPLQPIPADGEPHTELYNTELEHLAKSSKHTWYSAPWLFAECYLYRFLRSLFSKTEHWNSCDPFLLQKTTSFEQSGTSILQIATTMHELEKEKDLLDADKRGSLFREMVQMCLWGNATDLSLLTHLSPADIADIQAVGREAQVARQHLILKDDQSEVWAHVQNLRGGRVDFVLDNAGFELFTDLVFADFLVTYTPHVSQVYFHPKLIPWFVSDVTPADFSQTFTSLLDPSFFTGKNSDAPILGFDNLKNMVLRWKGYLDKGVFVLSVPIDTPLGAGNDDLSSKAAFWTTPYPYWNMETQAPELFSTLKASNLVIFKGDLNYRKLTGDVQWPSWTSFAEAIGPLAGSFPILSMRTNKADVAVGLTKEIVEQLDESGNKWRIDGRHALISFQPASDC